MDKQNTVLPTIATNSIDVICTQYLYQDTYRNLAATWTEILRILKEKGKFALILNLRQDLLMQLLLDIAKVAVTEKDGSKNVFSIDHVPIICLQPSNNVSAEGNVWLSATKVALLAIKKKSTDATTNSSQAIIPNTWLVNSPMPTTEENTNSIFNATMWTENHCPTIHVNKSTEHEKWFYCRKCDRAYPKSKLIFHKDHEIHCSTCTTYGKINDHLTHQTYPAHEFYPIPLPIDMVNALINFISDKKQLICDPLCGDGTIPLCAHLNDRTYIGIEHYEPYMKIAQARLDFFATAHYTPIKKL